MIVENHTATRVFTLVFPSQNTLLKPQLSFAIVALSSERVPDHPRRCLDAHGCGLCPRLNPGAGPRLTARCPPGGGLRADYTEKASGAQRDRPQLQAALDYMRPDDTLVVWKLDRLARSLRQLLDTVEALHIRQMGLRSLTEAIDTSTPGGTLVFHLFGALAEFERSIIRERPRAGLAAARARGRTGAGPRPSLQLTRSRPGRCSKTRDHRGGGGAPLAGLAGDAVSPLSRGPEWPRRGPALRPRCAACPSAAGAAPKASHGVGPGPTRRLAGLPVSLSVYECKPQSFSPLSATVWHNSPDDRALSCTELGTVTGCGRWIRAALLVGVRSKVRLMSILRMGSIISKMAVRYNAPAGWW